MMNNPKKNNGFTLMELMIVVAIVAILGAIAIPSYNNSVLRGKRSEGRSALLDTATRLERFYSDNNRYATADNTLASGNATSETGLYNITIATTGTYQTYTLTATPTFTDADCATLTLTQAGVKAATGANTTDCWDK